MLLHVVEAPLPVQRQQHGGARLQLLLHEVNGLGTPAGDTQHGDVTDEPTVIRLWEMGVSGRAWVPVLVPVQGSASGSWVPV